MNETSQKSQGFKSLKVDQITKVTIAHKNQESISSNEEVERTGGRLLEKIVAEDNDESPDSTN